MQTIAEMPLIKVSRRIGGLENDRIQGSTTLSVSRRIGGLEMSHGQTPFYL